MNSKWEEVKRLVEKKSPKISEFIDEVNIINIDNNVLSIELIGGHSFHITALEKDTSIIEDVLLDIFKKKLKIKYTINKEEKEKEEPTQTQDNEKDAEGHPLFIKAIERYFF